MKAQLVLLPLVLFTMASPAAAQAARTYVCSVDGSNEVVRWKFGAGEMHEFRKGVWSSNWCEDKYTACEIIDSGFVVSDPFYEFFHETSTGRFDFEDEYNKTKMSGTCRPG